MMRAACWLGVVVGLFGVACFAEPEDTCSTDPDSCEAAGSTTADATTATMDGSATSTSPSTTMTPSTTGADSADETSGGPAPGSSTGEASTGDGMGDSTTGVALCGNGVLDPEEECDGTDACTDCELDNFDCNPLNNAGCPDGTKCSFEDESGLFWCLPFSMDPPGMLHEGSCYNGGPLDQWCDVGLACMPGQTNGACKDGGCCVEFCDIFDTEFECAQKGDDCIVWFPPDAPDGLEWLGVCITP